MHEAEQAVANGEMVTGNFTFQAAMPNGKNFTISGYIYAHNTLIDISRQIDLAHDVIDRQRARAEIPVLELDVERKFQQLRDYKEHLAGAMAARNNVAAKDRKSSTDKAALNKTDMELANAQTNIGKLEFDIDKGLKAIEDMKKKAA